MYRIAFFAILWTAECANYQRYDMSSTQSPYSTYSTISNLYNQYPPKSTYGSDIANFPEATRYPNYNQGYTSSNYNSYSSTSGLYNGIYSTQRYGQNYGQNSYGQSNYGQNYGQNNGGYSSYEIPFMTGMRDYCVNRSPQVGIWVDSLMGMWYGVEFIQHLAGDARVDYARSCIVVHISEPVDQPSTEYQHFHVQHINAKFHQEYRHLRLLWDEAGHTIEYGLYFRNDSAGYWQVFDGQNGTLTTRPNYQQFSGSIQVLKAVSGHLVLNFCQEPKNGNPAQLYSVLFSRDPGSMARWEIDSIHSMLQNKKLSVASRRMVCGNNAVRTVHSLILCFMIFILSKFTS